jgi:hypothetical protein
VPKEAQELEGPSSPGRRGDKNSVPPPVIASRPSRHRSVVAIHTAVTSFFRTAASDIITMTMTVVQHALTNYKNLHGILLIAAMASSLSSEGSPCPGAAEWPQHRARQSVFLDLLL